MDHKMISIDRGTFPGDGRSQLRRTNRAKHFLSGLPPSIHGRRRRSRGRVHLRSERPYNSSVPQSAPIRAVPAISALRPHLLPIVVPVVLPALAPQPPSLAVAFEGLRFEAAVGFQEGRGGGCVEEAGACRGIAYDPGNGRRKHLQVDYVVVLWIEDELAVLSVVGAVLRRDEVRGIIIIIHGLNEHSGRYAYFAKQLTSCNFGVYAMDWIGHGGSDGLHGYVPSLDHVVADTGIFLEKIKAENPHVPCFLFGHSTGGAVVLKAASHPHIQGMLEGIILTSPALRVKPAHPIVGAVAPLFSLVAPKFQFKGANKRGIPVSRDPAALKAKYSDPLVYTGPIRVRTGHEILRISSYLMQNLKCVTVPFLVLHGTADKVTDPLASLDLYKEAASKFKDIKLYEGFLHDLLFEPEREAIAGDIISWMEKRLQEQSW